MMNRTKENWIAFYTLFRREIVRVLRIWGQTLLPPVITMTLYFLIFGRIIGGRIGKMHGFDYIQYIVPGLIMMAIITNSYANVVSSFFGAKFQKHIEEMLVAPISYNLILSGFVAGGVVRGLMVGSLITIVAAIFTELSFQNVWVTCITVFLTALLFALAGFFNGLFARKMDDINIIPVFFLTPLTYLGGVFYSVHSLSPFWRTITYMNPIFYMVNAFRYGMLGYSEVNIRISLTVLVGIIIGLYFLNIRLFTKGVGIKN